MDAYEELYRRHVDGATRVANTVASSVHEATDIVFEAFARVLVHLRESGTPATELARTLRIVVRRIAFDRHVAAQPWPDAAGPATAGRGEVDDADENIRRAFDALSDEWQQALWHAEVERRPKASLSRGLHMTPGEVAALITRAGEVLRQAFLGAKLSSEIRPECRPSVQNLYAYVQRTLPGPIAGELTMHIGRCADCRRFRDDLLRLSTDLGPTLYAALLRPRPEARAAAAPTAQAPTPGLAPAETVPAVETAASAGGSRPAWEPTRPEPSRPEPSRPQPSRAADRAPEAVPEAASTMPDVGLAGVSVAADGQAEPGRGRARVLAMAFGLAACVAASAYVAYQHADSGTTAVSETTASAGQDPTGTAGGSGTQNVVALTVDDPAANAPDGVVAAPPNDAQDEGVDPATSTDDDVTSTSPDAPPSPSDSPSPTEPSTSPSPTPLLSEEPGTAPQIEVHPANISAVPGQSAILSVRATGAPRPAIQWQERVPGGSGWSDVAGGVSAELTVRVADAGFDGRAYRAMVTNDVGAVASEAAVLTVEFAPQITAQPGDARVAAGGEVFLEASASAKPGMTDVRWQVRRPGDGSWHDVPASFPAGTLTRLKLSDVDSGMDGYDYRAVFANAHGEAATDPATISVDSAGGS